MVVEHGTTHEQRAIGPDALPKVSRDADAQQGRQQEMRTEQREIHRASGEQQESTITMPNSDHMTFVHFLTRG